MIINNTGLDLVITADGGNYIIDLPERDVENEPVNMLVAPNLDYPETIAEFLEDIDGLDAFVNDDDELVLIK